MFALHVHFTTFFLVLQKRPSLHVQPANYKWSEKQVKNEVKHRAMCHFLLSFNTPGLLLQKHPRKKALFLFVNVCVSVVVTL